MAVATDPLWNLIDPYLAAEGLELDDLVWTGSGRSRVLRVVVDGPPELGVDRLAEVSTGLSRLLDAEESLQGPYTLEVTSPGLERPLRRPSHYQKSLGREVVVNTREPVADATSHRGTLTEADDQGFVMETELGHRRIEYPQVGSARTVFRWERRPKPGSAAARRQR